MRVLFLTEGTEIPSSRYRVEQFIPWFERADIACTVRQAYGPAYNRVNEERWAPIYKTATRLRRVAWTLAPGHWDILFLQRTALPGTALPELIRSARSATRIVFDVDDAIYIGPDSVLSPLRATRFRDAARIAHAVIVGNTHLAERVADPAKTTVIPTAVDTDTYRPPAQRDPDRPVVGWMGTSSNFPSLREVIPQVLPVLASRPDTTLRIVSNGVLSELQGHPQVEQLPWAAASEVEQLQSFDIGLMPLLDNQATLGKCGFKMLQYMSVGSAPLASAVGANVELVGASDSARLVPLGGDWGQALRRLLDDLPSRQALQLRARAHVHALHSVRLAAPRYVELFRRLHAGLAPFATTPRPGAAFTPADTAAAAEPG